MQPLSLCEWSPRLVGLIGLTALCGFNVMIGMSNDPPFSIPELPPEQQPELLLRILHAADALLFIGLVYLALSFNRVTTVDPAKEQIRIRDYIVFFLPYRTRTFAYYEVLTIACSFERDQDCKKILRVYVVTAGHRSDIRKHPVNRIEIMHRSLPSNFNECLKSARRLAKITSSRCNQSAS